MPDIAGRYPRLWIWLQRAWRFRSAGLGFSLAYGFVFAISAALFLSLLWWHTVGSLEHQVEQAVEADAHNLREHWAESGLPGLILAIQDRLDLDVEDQALYLLVSSNGEILAGNMPAWPTQVSRFDQFYPEEIIRAGTTATAEVHAYSLPGGDRLLVGRDIRGRELLARLLTDTFLWSWAMVTALAVGGGLVVRGIFRRILSSIAHTTSAIARGDMRERMPIVGNEVDLVAHSVNDMLDRVARLMDGVKQVSNAIAHDLRTPITRARARLEDAALTERNPERLRQAMERAVMDLDHVTAVFEALLRIAQIEAGARRAAFEVCDLTIPLHDVAELYEASAEERHVRLVIDLPPRLMFYGDARLIQQGVANLLDNALKFAPQHSVVHIKAASSGGQVRISVADEGPGMSEADLARASERFFRADAARNTPGAGLGLSLVQAIAQLHNGTLVLETRRPGLRATLTLAAALPTPTMTEESHLPNMPVT